MRFLPLLSLLPFAAACATPARLVVTSSDTVISVPEAARRLAAADVVVLGELHATPAVHELHFALLRALHEQRDNLVVAMEMFDRDVQTALLQYLTGMSGEDVFRREARVWPRYDTDYRPVVEYAKANGLLVLAANAPQALVARAARDGAASVAGEKFVARETSAPEDEYFQAFAAAMRDDGGAHAHGGSLAFLYQAQCLRDDTMAETVADHLRARHAAGDRPLCVLICGRGHSDHRRGVIARLLARMPELDVRVLSSELVPDLGAGVYALPADVADLVVVAQGRGRESTMVAPAPAPAPAPAAPSPAPPTNPEGQRPALGLMPDYQDASGLGVLVAQVRPGGSADLAGIEPGDYVVALAGVRVSDVHAYTEVLDEQTIGRTITVRIRRDDAEVDLQIKVAARSR
ncbi:MAG: ChaN family lipoprotein [Planctomycetes bacterium]|nr:ChaN family lipoprotein [Planctomycetota bacterium]